MVMNNVSAIFLGISAVLALASCGEPYEVKDFYNFRGNDGREASRPKILGYGPVTFGMTADAAAAALGENGQFIEVPGQAKPALFWKAYQGAYEFDAWAYFTPTDNKLERVELNSVNALYNATTIDQCRDYFEIFVTAITTKYGPLDYENQFKPTESGSGESSKAFITFSDSSSVRAYYDYDAESLSREEPACKVRFSYNMGWAKAG
jgi:hypothetical protein